MVEGGFMKRGLPIYRFHLSFDDSDGRFLQDKDDLF